MYESPIEIIYGKMQMNFEDNVMKAVQDYQINVNKDSLISALMYDRHQYEKGYEDGKQSIIHCKDCKYYHVKWDGTEKYDSSQYWCEWVEPDEDDFCSLAEPKGGINDNHK